MPHAADLIVLRITNTDDYLVRFGASQLWGADSMKELQRNLSDIIESGRVRLVLDLSDIAVITTEILGTFVAIHDKATEQGGYIHLAQPQANVQRALAITKLDRIFEILPTVPPVVQE